MGRTLIQISGWIERRTCEAQCFFDFFAGELELFAEAFFAGGAFFVVGAGLEAGNAFAFAAVAAAGGAGSPLPFFFPGAADWAAGAAA